MASTDRSLRSLRDIWARRWGLATVIFLLAATAGSSVVMSLPNVYRATATVLVEQGHAESLAPGVMESRLQLITQEILSRSRLESVIRQFGLYPKLRLRASLEPAVDQLRRDIHTESKVQPLPTGVGVTIAFAIGYRGRDPELVAKVANSLAASYLDEDRKIRGAQANGTVQVLKGQLEDAKRQLQEQEHTLGAFQEQHMGELPQQSEANLAEIERLNAELRTASDERIRALDRQNELLKQLASGDAVGTSPATPSDPAARLAKKKEQLAELSQRFNDKYPDVIRLKEEVAALEKEAAGVEEAARTDTGTGTKTSGPAVRLRETLKEVETEIASLRADETRLRAAIAERIRRLELTPRRQRAYQEISRDYQTTRELYDSVNKRYEQALLEGGSESERGTSPLRILDPALVPTDAAAPNRPVLLFVGLLACFGTVAAALALAEYVDTSLHSAEELRALTSVPVLVSIPLIVTPSDLRSQRRQFLVVTLSVLSLMVVISRAAQFLAQHAGGLVSILARARP